MNSYKIGPLALTVLHIAVVVFLAAATSKARPFEVFLNEVDAARRGENRWLLLRVEDDQLAILRGQASALDADAFGELIEKASEEDVRPAYPGSRSDGTPVLVYTLSPGVQVEAYLEGESLEYSKIDYAELAQYPSKKLVPLLKEAVFHGLETFRPIPEVGVFLSFRRTGPAECLLGSQEIRLPTELYRDMRIVGRYGRRAGTSGGVIFVHEPHWMLGGQYQLISGVKALIDANPSARFHFLVEGWYDKLTKDVQTGPTRACLREDVPARPQVLHLLDAFLVDGPFAYRLLHAPDLPAVAIDDPQVIADTPPALPSPERSLLSCLKAVETRLKRGKELSLLSRLHSQLVIAQHLRRLESEEAIAHYEAMAELCRAIVDATAKKPELKGMAERQTLLEHARVLKREAVRCKKALLRDGVMADAIEEWLKHTPQPAVPLVFIGNFHTKALIDRLPEEYGYVVLEPRIQYAGGECRGRFNKALHSRSRTSYLKGLPLKLPVAPHPTELPAYRSILERVAADLQKRRGAFVTSSPLGTRTSRRIIAAVESNGALCGAEVGFGDEGTSPPSPFEGAFASVDLTPGKKRLLLYDQVEENWQADDRLRYLSRAGHVLIGRDDDETPTVWFDYDEQTRRVFFLVYTPKTRSCYLFEGDGPMDVLNTLLPRFKEFHLRFSRAKPRTDEERTANG